MRRRTVVYSGSRAAQPRQAPKPVSAAKAAPRPRFTWRKALVPSLLGVILVLAGALWATQPRGVSQAQVEALVHRAIDEIPPKPSATQAFEKILPSVVAVRAMADDGEEGTQGMAEGKADVQRGTGVVIVESGIILTNLHVVSGARRIHVTFSDGHESEAQLIGQRAEHDLAVLQAKTLPDDIMPATMRSTSGLRPGDEVVAVGFPFGIGPSASAGVISGLKRDYVSPDGRQSLSNLIQFDAAVNPGNSGGPLLDEFGHVAGVVTLKARLENVSFAIPVETLRGIFKSPEK